MSIIRTVKLDSAIKEETKYKIYPPVATNLEDGVMSSSDKIKLDNIEELANHYILEPATASDLGGIKIGYSDIGANIGVKLNSEYNSYVTLTQEAVLSALGYDPSSYSLPLASDVRGGLKIGYVANGANASVSLDNEYAYVTITDDNITAALGYDPSALVKTFNTSINNHFNDVSQYFLNTSDGIVDYINNDVSYNIWNYLNQLGGGTLDATLVKNTVYNDTSIINVITG